MEDTEPMTEMVDSNGPENGGGEPDLADITPPKSKKGGRKSKRGRKRQRRLEEEEEEEEEAGMRGDAAMQEPDSDNDTAAALAAVAVTVESPPMAAPAPLPPSPLPAEPEEETEELPDHTTTFAATTTGSPANMELEDAVKEAEPGEEEDTPMVLSEPGEGEGERETEGAKAGDASGAPDGVVEPEAEARVETEAPFPSEYDRLYKVVEENVEDFNAWVYLLQYVEQENHLAAAQKAFDAFFQHYPYCYGYWKKFADIEKKNGNVHIADEVYRRGLQAIPLSVDLWLHYIAFVKDNQDTSDGEAEGRIRATYEHAALAAGTDFRSDRLWEAYVAWETEQNKPANVTAIYDRVLGIPTQLYSQHFQRFKEHVQSSNPKHFLSETEFVALRKELAAGSVTGSDGEEAGSPPGEELPPGTEDLADPAKRVTEIENMRHKVIEARQEIFNHNEHEVSKRWAFEEGIKRPYFHVKPLEKSQLSNWREYLDFELENGTPERAVVLFERCLIACALYEEFWIKYAKYLEGYSIEGVRHVYKKACTIHLPKKPTVHLLWAAFEEQQGSIDEARRVLKSLEEAVPGLAMVRLRRVSLERRHGNLEEAEALLRDAMVTGSAQSDGTEISKEVETDAASHATTTSFYAVKLARQLMKVQRSKGKAKKVLLEAIEKDQASPKLYLNLLELEYSGDVQQNEADIVACFDRALRSSMPLEARLTFAQRKVEFLEDFGSDVNVLVAAYEEHQKLLRDSDSTKRKAENGSQEPDTKRQKIDEASTNQVTPDMQTGQQAYNYNWYQQQYGYQNTWGQYNQYAQYSQYYPPPPT
ncbi:pre-mRNA-processing factor 39 [Engraulis encrasicolus]|uniref:pre-mRNA-processing factor 39 n=1 Tax=Engraulis encrasicolus TaxID=184585 RepID=UPI002FD1F944